MSRYFVFIFLFVLAVACTPGDPAAAPVETVRPSPTPTIVVATDPPPAETVGPMATAVLTDDLPLPWPTNPPTLPPTLTPPADPPTRVPNPAIEPTPWIAPQGSAFWYRDGDSILRYDFSSGETMTLVDMGGWEIESAAMTDYDGGWLAYVDHVGLQLLSFGGGTPQMISESIGEWYVRGLLFSPDGRFLAYTDITGLRIYDLADGSDRLVWVNDVEYMNEDPPGLTIHRAMSWSADQQWLTVWIGKWEGGWLDVGSLETGALYELYGCYEAHWSPIETVLAMAVRYNGYLGCGGDIDGLYRVETGPDGIDQQKIYAEEVPDPNFGYTGTAEVVWAPDGTQILFVWDEEQAPIGRLMLSAPDGSAAQTLVESESGSIRTPFWSGDGRFIYYVINIPGNTDSGTIFVYEVATGESRPIYSTDGLISIRDLSPDEGWMLVSGYNQFRNTGLTLVNIADGTAVNIETESEEAWVGWQQP